MDIWEKGQTFPADMIEGFKDKLNSRSTPLAYSLKNPSSRCSANSLGISYQC